MNAFPSRRAPRPHCELFVGVLLCRVVHFVLVAFSFGITKAETLLDGTEFEQWERPLTFARTYYVEAANPDANDTNPGTAALPFRTVSRAATVLQPGERVLIGSGIYRERVAPNNSGSGPDRMISYEAAPGANVVIRGSRVVTTGWSPSTGYRLPSSTSSPRILRLDLEPFEFAGYNPFGVSNVLADRKWLQPKPEELRPYLLRRGLVFCDGQRLQQVEMYRELALKQGAYWVEQNGLTLHVRLPGDANPAGHLIEVTTQEQVFAPRKEGLSYIRVRGLTLEHAANGFPVPQRGLLSTSKGHHWIIENCTIREANGVGIDFGAQDWNAIPPDVCGFSIVRSNTVSDIGVCGVAAYRASSSLIQGNTIERIGWHDVELMWESGGIKLHHATNSLLQGNVIRHLTYAPGIWLDAGNRNTRVTGNVIADLRDTVRGAIYIEVSQYPNLIDHNLIWGVSGGKGGSTNNWAPEPGRGVILDGTDDTVVRHNLFGRCDVAVHTRTSENRIVGTRGGTARNTQVLYNIFFRCSRSLQLSSPSNIVDGNAYIVPRIEEVTGSGAEGRGLNWLPELKTTLYLDVAATRKYFGYERNGTNVQLALEFDADALILKTDLVGDLPVNPTDSTDLDGISSHVAGPFGTIPAGKAELDVDPRRASPRILMAN